MRVGGVVARVEDKSDKSFGVGGESAAQYGLLNKINSESECVRAGHVRYVVAQLIFFLIAQNGKRGDRCDKLIVTEGFESRSGGRGGAERKCESEAKIGIARLRKVEEACAEDKRSNPGGAEGVLIA